jgi:hypothetical protein
MNRATRRNIIIIGILCFILGIVFARPIAVAWLRPDPTELASTPTVDTDTTYAIILIDDFSSEQPQVDGMWLAWIPADYTTVELVGIPPAPYRDEYSHELKGVASFTIQQYIHGTLAGSLVLDRNDMVELTDQLGGVLLEGRHADGPSMLSYYTDANLDHQDRLFRQAAMFQSLIAQAALMGTSFSYEALLQLPSLNTIQRDPLYETVRHYYPLRTDQIQIRTLTDSAQ